MGPPQPVESAGSLTQTLLARGRTVCDRWVVVRKLGEGQFADVYEVRDAQKDSSDARYAMKVEKRSEARTVRQEYRVLRRLAQACPQVVSVLHAGNLSPDRFFLVMDLLGANLADVRRAAPDGRLDGRSVRLLAGQLLDALQAVHAAGYIHRDVKPANFAMVPGSADVGEWRLLDFGLARRYLDDAGVPLPARPAAAFRGSTTYASVNAHAGADLSRRDDLWSWLYCVVELAEGTLPWRQDAREADPGGGGGGGGSGAPDAYRAHVAALKQECVADAGRLARLSAIQGFLAGVCEHLSGLGFSDVPDYGLLRRLVCTIPDTWEEAASPAELPPSTATPGRSAPATPPTPPLARTIEQLQALIASAAGGGSSIGDAAPEGGDTTARQLPPSPCEAAAVRNMCEAVAWVHQGGAGPAVEELVSAAGLLHPVDGVAVVAAVLGGAVAGTHPSACNALAVLLQDVALFAQAAAKHAISRHAAWRLGGSEQAPSGPSPAPKPLGRDGGTMDEGSWHEAGESPSQDVTPEDDD